MIVVDASLAAKWLFVEPGSEAATKFAAEYGRQLCAPDLLFTEVAAVAIRRANIDPRLREESVEALQIWTRAWHDGVVEAHRITPLLLHESAMLALTLTHPLADCVYLALAVSLSCGLVTCDAKFVNKARTAYPGVRLLADFDLDPGFAPLA